jgi:hypothetical protein
MLAAAAVRAGVGTMRGFGPERAIELIDSIHYD